MYVTSAMRMHHAYEEKRNINVYDHGFAICTGWISITVLPELAKQISTHVHTF